MPHTIEDLNRRKRHRLAVNARWLLRLRWVAVAGQLITISGAHWGLGVRLPLAPLSAIIALTAATNAVLTLAWNHQIREEAGPLVESRGESWLALVMGVDLISLSVLLSLTGGLANPFTVFYFVNLTLSTVVLAPRLSWLLTALAMASLLAVQLLHRPLPAWQSADDVPQLREFGALAAFGACAVVVVYFVTRVVNELQQRELELRRAERERASAERLESLATLAAGAGHELASPLSTIAVIASDLNRHLQGVENVPASVRQDVTLIRQELDHCRSILHRMSSQAGHDLSEEITDIGVDELMEQVLSGLRHRERIEVEMPEDVAHLPLRAPLEGLAQAIRGVVQNGIDHSLDSEPVSVSASREQHQVKLTITDRGEGMDPLTLSRAAEPFFTTKETGNGMGLGLFLTRNVIERLGGQMRLESKKGAGTTAEIRLPIAET